MSLQTRLTALIDAIAADYKSLRAADISVGEDLRDYVQSRGTDLITNGTGYLRDNTNFPNSVFTPSDTPAGTNGSFVYPASGSNQASLSELVPVDMGKRYVASVWAKQMNPSATSARAYLAIMMVDAYGQFIAPNNYMYRPGTTTHLTQALNPGDTVIKVASTQHWMNSAGSASHWRNIIWWDYIDPGGKAWPKETYSRNTITNAYADGGITDSTTITLSSPYSGAAKPVGTKLSNGGSGSTFLYTGLVNNQIPNEWTQFVGSPIGGIHTMPTTPGATPTSVTTRFAQGTATLGFSFLYNRDATASQHAFAGLSFSDVSAAQQAADANVTAHEAAENPHPQYFRRDQPIESSDWSYGISEYGVYASQDYNNQEHQVQLNTGLGLLVSQSDDSQTASFVSSPEGISRVGYSAFDPDLPDAGILYPGTREGGETFATREWVADELMYGRLVNPSALYPWQASLGNALAQPSNIVIVGDSITEGTGAANFFATWPSRLQAVLRAQKHHIGGGAGYIAAAPTTGAVVPALPLTTSGVTYQMGKFGLGGRVALIGNTAGDHITYNPQQCTQVRVWFSKGWFGGGLKIEIDGVDQLAGVSSNAQSAADEKGGEFWTSPVLAPGLHTVKISSTSTGWPVFLEGVEFFNNDATHGIRVYNAGHYGYTTADFITANMQKHWESVWKLNPGLGIIALGSNDLAVSGMTGATFAANLTTLISRFPSTTPILILFPPQRGDYQTAANTLLYNEMKTAARALATGRVAFFDMQDWWPTLTSDVASGQGLMYDLVHPSTAGMETYAEVIREHIGYPFRRR